MLLYFQFPGVDEAGGEGGGLESPIHMESGGRNARPSGSLQENQELFRSLYSDTRVAVAVARISASCHGKNCRSHSEKLLLHGESYFLTQSLFSPTEKVSFSRKKSVHNAVVFNFMSLKVKGTRE